ncbi:hypothetical protein [Phenylobacterium sp.]|uniref:hypothetical protein n=1 Tax=Phenylobacterium sp. TaxID=1871053 RepID=UPI002735B8FD|nr:hypothetical protein [Phenylobacterium sp.]MDP3659043.1 hypothetical protein [Phenylobacterium sp.]
MLSLTLAAVLAALAQAPVQDAPAPGGRIEVLQSRFGTLGVDAEGRDILTPTAVVPLKTGQGYGWEVLVRTERPSLKWRETFVLPKPASTWGVTDAGVAVSEDARTAITEREVSAATGVISNAWQVADGDPAGHYTIRVEIEDLPEITFEFEVK